MISFLKTGRKQTSLFSLIRKIKGTTGPITTHEKVIKKVALETTSKVWSVPPEIFFLSFCFLTQFCSTSISLLFKTCFHPSLSFPCLQTLLVSVISSPSSFKLSFPFQVAVSQISFLPFGSHFSPSLLPLPVPLCHLFAELD